MMCFGMTTRSMRAAPAQWAIAPGISAVENADFLLVIGCRLNVRQISYNWSAFAWAAFTVMIDIDQAELSKLTWSIDLPIFTPTSPRRSACWKRLTTNPRAPTASIWPGAASGWRVTPWYFPSIGKQTNR